MPFCYSPWTNLDISPQGNITPCCKFQTKHYTQLFNIQKNSLDDYAHSTFLNNIKQEFNEGTWPLGCERCKIEEKNGIESKRQLDYLRWSKDYQQYDFEKSKWITSSVAFGNTCNLKCITCNSISSSHWQKEYQHIYNVTSKHVKFYRNGFVENFIERAPDIIHLDIPGGEPFLSGVPEQQKLLNHYVESGQSSNITLHYTTNATIFPDQTWWDLWKHFKEVDMQLSIDGVGARYEYIRYPADWNQVSINIQQYLRRQSSNFKTSVSHTVSAYNIYYLDEFFTWCYNVGLARPWLGRVHTPSHMRPTVWNQLAKSVIENKLQSSSFNDVRVWAKLVHNNNDSDRFEDFQKFVHQHDQYRNLDFRTTFPEMAPYI